MLKIIIISLFTFAFANEGDHKVHAYKKAVTQEKHKGHDNHDHGKDDHEEDHKEDHKEEHKEEHKEDHKDEHGHSEESEMSENGFKLNDRSIKTFGLLYLKYTSPQTVVSKEAIYKGLSEVNLYRLRDGFFKRIDFKTLSQNKDNYTVSSADLKNGDQIVIRGVGFLRIAEIAASGGLSDSHSH